MSEAPINIVSYDPNWIQQFETEKAGLLSIIENYVEGSIEHVGSTAIVGMVAKPIIDIMVGVESLSASKAAINVLSKNAYCYYPYKADTMHWFCKPSPEVRTHHLHLIPYKSDLWLERIAFRDLLRNNAHVAADYAKLKVELAEKHRNNRELYTQQKWPFIQKSLESHS